MRLDVRRMRTASVFAPFAAFLPAPFAALVVFAAALLMLGCHGAGPYGHAPKYAELDDETVAAAGAREYDPVMVQRQPDEWRAGKVALFGVVENRTAGPNGQALLKLGVRRLEVRNLCDNADDDDSCRVTVSDKDFGIVWALVQLHGGDDVGPHSIGMRSLVRVVGKIGQDVSPADGSPVVRATYYRHWPPYFYVTRASARDMRQ
jgi:hypothetical protein